MGSNPSRFKAVGPNAPVEETSWDDAIQFCKLFTKRERAGFPKDTNTRYQPKPNGITPAELEPKRHTPAFHLQWDGPTTTARKPRTQSLSYSPTTGGSKICLATY
ncbi:MAG: hypothetical protein ACJ07L_12610 [Opitutales bacterium]